MMLRTPMPGRMPNWKVIGTIVLGTVVGFMLNPQSPVGAALWGAAPEGGEAPTGGQIGLLMAVSLVEAIAFGVGLAFLFFGRSAMRRVLGSGGFATAAQLAIAWGLLSWVPHSAMHQTNGDNMARLIVIEYVFHVTLIAAAALLAWAFVRAPGRASAGAAAATA